MSRECTICIAWYDLNLVRDSQGANATQNLVRKSLYFNYDHYKAIGKHAFENKGDVFQRHVSKLFEPSLKGHC